MQAEPQLAIKVFQFIASDVIAARRALSEMLGEMQFWKQSVRLRTGAA